MNVPLRPMLRGGRPVAISYVETVLRNPLNRDTNYEIVGIRPAGE